MDIAHTDNGVQLVARRREANGDGGAGSLLVGAICSLGSSLPLLVVVGGHCVFEWMRMVDCAFPIYRQSFGSQLFYRNDSFFSSFWPGPESCGKARANRCCRLSLLCCDVGRDCQTR
jgi:hypothetical protein